MRILAVDDEPLFLEVLEAALKDLGFADVTPIYSAKEALRELESGKTGFDCILLDIRMPGTSGVELCRKIRAIAGHKRTPIMMITALTDRAYIDEAFAAGASDYLTKPLDALELKARMSMIERLIAEQSRNIFLEQSVEASSGADDEDEDFETLDFEFEAPVAMAGLDRIIDYPAMEDYLSSLPVKESYAAAVFAVSIRNADAFYANARRVDYLNMLHDVGVTLETVLKRHEAMISYAGKGIFVVAIIGTQDPDLRPIEMQIRQRLGDYQQIYERDKLPAPVVVLGAAVRKSLFTRPHAGDLLHAAMVAVEKKPTLLLPAAAALKTA